MYKPDTMKNSTFREVRGALLWRNTPGDDAQHHQGASPRVKTRYSVSPYLSNFRICHFHHLDLHRNFRDIRIVLMWPHPGLH